MSLPVAPSAVSSSVAPAASSARPNKAAAKDDSFSFWDLIDVVNPLQHIPVVSTIYRAVTGDKMGNFARIAGGAVFGGFVGAAVGGINAIVAQENNGDDIGALAMHKIGIGSDTKPEAKTQLADTKNIPVIEVHPARENIPSTPRFVAATSDLRAGIIWDTPQTVQAALPKAKNLEKNLAALDVTDPIDKAQIPNRMMDALLKYQALRQNDG